MMKLPKQEPGVPQAQLARTINLPLLTFYGLGTILGAGIYVLIGTVAGYAGVFTPLAFLLAAAVAGTTAFSYAQLSALFPHSAGEAAYVWEGFNQRLLSVLVGWLIVFTGVVSVATLVNGFVGYFNVFVSMPPVLAIVLLLVLMGGLAVWGISESLWVAAAMTLVEIGGLILVLVFNMSAFTRWPDAQLLVWPADFASWSGIFTAAFIAFYAFIGFEDIVNIAEEVKRPETNLPRAIFLALAIASILYMLVAWVAIVSVPVEALATSDAPLSLLLEKQSGHASQLVAFISLFAIINGVLIQMIMASRLLYGMACRGGAPAWLASVSIRTHTPVLATLLVVGLVLVFALWLPLAQLARLTSFTILMVFILVNAALWQVKRKRPELICSRYVPTAPLLAGVLCVVLLLLEAISIFSY